MRRFLSSPSTTISLAVRAKVNAELTDQDSDNDCRVSVIVPTYCEAKNLPILVPRICEAFEEGGLTGEIIIVDDDSPDQTLAVCDELAARYPVRLEIRQGERGLSSAVIHGMRMARGQVLLVMDADLSHPAHKIPELVSALSDKNTDFVIGSRYVPGGGTDENWGFFRWLNSKVATGLARPLTSARDPMAGFFALRRESFQSANALDPVGYKIGLELIVKCRCRNIHEVPIYFSDRLHGESKLSVKEQLNYLRHLKRLYEFKLGVWAQPVMFGLIGLSGVVVDLTVLSLLLYAVSAYLARAVAIGCAMTWNFYWNRQLTFSKSRRRHVLHQYVLFVMSCSVGALIDMGVFSLLYANIAIFTAIPQLAAMIGILCGAVFNFLMSKYVAFK